MTNECITSHYIQVRDTEKSTEDSNQDSIECIGLAKLTCNIEEQTIKKVPVSRLSDLVKPSYTTTQTVISVVGFKFWGKP